MLGNCQLSNDRSLGEREYKEGSGSFHDEIDFPSNAIKKLVEAKVLAKRQSTVEDHDSGINDVISVTPHRSISHASH